MDSETLDQILFEISKLLLSPANKDIPDRKEDAYCRGFDDAIGNVAVVLKKLKMEE